MSEAEALNNQQPLLNFPILRVIKRAHQKHGLRQGNYLRYRGYCTRRIRRLRRSLDITNSHKSFLNRPAKFTRRVLTPENIVNARCLESILFAAERCWAYSMHLKNEIGSPSSMSYERRHYHMKRKNKRAAKYAGQLRQLVNECNLFNESTKLEAKAYRSWMLGCSCLNYKKPKKALKLFNTSRKIYNEFAEKEDDSGFYVLKCQEIDNFIRLCRYVLGYLNESPKMNEGELLDLDFNKLSVDTKPKKNVIVKVLEPMPCKPLFFDISMNYCTKKY